MFTYEKWMILGLLADKIRQQFCGGGGVSVVVVVGIGSVKFN